MQRLLADWPAHACLVFLMRQTPDTRKALYKLISAQARVCRFAPLSEGDAAAHIRKMVRTRGCEISVADARFLLRYTGAGLAQLDNEAAKLCALVGAGGQVQREHIEMLCEQSQEYRIYELTDALFAGQTQRALALLRRMLSDGEEPTMLIAMLARQTRLLAAAAAEPRITAQQLAGAMDVKLYPAKKAITLGNALGLARVGRCLALCVAADSAIKQGRYEGRAAVEELAMRIARLCAGA